MSSAKTFVVGYVGKDPENFKGVVKFSIANTTKWKDKKTGDNREKTDWHNIVCFGTTGEIAQKVVRKGGKVYVEGNLTYNTWESKGGEKHTTAEIHANRIEAFSSGIEMSEEAGDIPF